MILSLILGTTLKAGGAEDFFPLATGTRMVYQQKSGNGTSSEVSSVVGKALDMGGATAFPVTEIQPGQTPATVYYRVDTNQVLLLGSDLKHLMPAPMPVLKMGAGKVEWDYDGATMTGVQGERLQAHGEAHAAGVREVMGKKVDVIEVDFKTQVGSGLSALHMEDHAVYGRGLGVIEMTRKVHLGGRHPQNVENSRKLIRFEPLAQTSGQGGG